MSTPRSERPAQNKQAASPKEGQAQEKEKLEPDAPDMYGPYTAEDIDAMYSADLQARYTKQQQNEAEFRERLNAVRKAQLRHGPRLG